MKTKTFKPNTLAEIDRFFKEHEKLLPQRENILKAIGAVIACFQGGGKLLLAGNGGSSADCDHIAGELMKAFKSKRRLSEEFAEKAERLYGEEGKYIAGNLERGLPAVSLTRKSL